MNLVTRSRLLVAVSIIALTACARPRPAEQAGNPPAEKMWQEFAASLEAGDLDRWLAMWTDDGVQMPPDEPAAVGKDRIRARMPVIWPTHEEPTKPPSPPRRAAPQFRSTESS
jgi:SnoaL-like protein